jgi:hypothetical protein
MTIPVQSTNDSCNAAHWACSQADTGNARVGCTNQKNLTTCAVDSSLPAA